MRPGPTIPMLSLALLAAPAALAEPSAAGPAAMTLDRFVGRQTARIMAADTDGDGRISRAEMMAAAKGRDPSRRFDAMDGNHDGYLDKDEIGQALTRRFRRLDTNGDGILSPDERIAARAAQGRGARGAGTPQP